jgi:hypothetical protein
MGTKWLKCARWRRAGLLPTSALEVMCVKALSAIDTYGAHVMIIGWGHMEWLSESMPLGKSSRLPLSGNGEVSQMGLRMCLAKIAAWLMSRYDATSAVLRTSSTYRGSSACLVKIRGAYGSTIMARTRYKRRVVADGSGSDELR